MQIGPCGLYRYHDGSLSQALEEYFVVVNRNPNETTIMEGNLILAEDRILSATCVLSAFAKHRSFYTSWVQDAIFYFEAETVFAILIKQRRRWINGTFFGYLWLYKRLQWLGRGEFIRKFLVTCQIYNFAIVAMSPAIFASALYVALSYWLTTSGGRLISYIIPFLYAIVFLIFGWVHKGEKISFHPTLFSIYMGLNAALISFISFTFLYSVITQIWIERTLAPSSVLALSVLLGPWVLSLLDSFPYCKVTWNMIR